jgi:hypothetical protein
MKELNKRSVDLSIKLAVARQIRKEQTERDMLKEDARRADLFLKEYATQTEDSPIYENPNEFFNYCFVCGTELTIDPKTHCLNCGAQYTRFTYPDSYHLILREILVPSAD